MRPAVEIENIDTMRRREGIVDAELWAQIGLLKAGDCVRLTFVVEATPPAAETLLVRITSIHGSAFRGKLTRPPVSGQLSSLRLGSAVAFNAAHIHSIVKGQPTHGH